MSSVAGGQDLVSLKACLIAVPRTGLLAMVNGPCVVVLAQSNREVFHVKHRMGVPGTLLSF